MTIPRLLPAAVGLVLLALPLAGGVGVAAAAQGADGGSATPDAGLSQLPATTAGTAGYCKTPAGVTVVVDFSGLGGDIVVRCAPTPVSNGVAALQKAGFEPAGTTKYGLAFVCRISGRPGAEEVLTVNGEPYEEQCVETPPQLAHWSYWAAPNGGEWAFLQSGASSHHPIAGGFEGWSFSLNRDVDSPPGIAPVRPVAAPSPAPSSSPTSSPTPPPPPPPNPPTTRPTKVSPTRETPSPSPSTAPPSALTSPTSAGGNPPGAPFPGDGASTPSASPSSRGTSLAPTPTATAPPGQGGDRKEQGGSAGQKPTRPRQPTDETRVPTTDGGPTPGHAEGETEVTGDLPGDTSATESAGSPLPILGFGLLAVLAAGAGLTAWRRSREE